MKVIGVIPARWGSSRFPGKILAELNGQPLLQHVWQQAKKSRLLNEVLIACDDERILKAAAGFKAQAVMTAKNHPSGTDRIAEAVKDSTVDIVVNIQGDEPLLAPEVIDGLAQCLLDDKNCQMATVIKAIEKEEEIANPNVVKVVIDHAGYALYFSRAAIPYNREQVPFGKIGYYKHLGLYAYRRDFLVTLKALPVSKLEQIEKLEQLRVLEAGYKIRTVITTHETIGVDTPEDLERVKRFFQSRKK